MRRFLIYLLLIVGIQSVYAQEDKKKDISKAGIKLDINSSTLLGDRADTMGSRTGLSAGLFYREALGGIFGGQIEIRYIQMGAHNTVQNFDLHLDYIRLGAQFKLYPLTSTLGA